VNETAPLKVLFLWHHHQPYYKADGKFLLPWVRMHGVKDYWDMVRILDDFPKIRQTFNFTPSLLEQLQDYLDNGAVDFPYVLSSRDPESFTGEDKVEALKTFFLANSDHMVKRYPAYAGLLAKQGPVSSDADLARAAEDFTTQDIRDLQVWWNLSWVGEYSRFDPPFKHFLDKQRNFTEDEKSRLLTAQVDILRKIVPHHKEAVERGQIEISVSPFYHPILPLLCDSNSGAEANPLTRLPKNRFKHPEDADNQIKLGLAYGDEIFGKRPRGMWPSEGSVSDAAIDLMIKNGVEWAATDEAILRKTLSKAGKHTSDDFTEKYFAYSFERSGRRLKILFRDHTLSDLIGFSYSKWGPDAAANDLIERLLKIRDSIKIHSGASALEFAVVPIILDGENAWEFYQSDGKDFLRTLYYGLSSEPRLMTVLASEVKVKRGNVLTHVEPGSWINGDFNIWIGHSEDNKAWDLLTSARDMFERSSENGPADEKSKAFKEIMIAEGSDWCWWYGDEHKSPQSGQFDQLYRYHLKQVYRLLGMEPHPELSNPIKKPIEKISRQPAGMISPKFDASERKSEWEKAGLMDQVGAAGSMQRTGPLVTHLYFGNDRSNYYLRIDTAERVTDEKVVVRFVSEPGFTIEIGKNFALRKEGASKEFAFSGRYSIDEVIQVAVEFGGVKTAEVALTVSIYRGSELIDLFPAQGTANFKILQ
jgi:alpha-amylase/alpha-mannosidase (GH57 family)